jgi:multicomponent Na+:H+ antiporter subunit G
MMPVTDILSWICIIAGSFFIVVGALGLVRMPELYSRMQAASVIDIAGGTLLLIGFMFQAGLGLVTFKLLILIGVFFYIGPVISHALAQAALHESCKPLLSEDRRERLGQAAAGEQQGGAV